MHMEKDGTYHAYLFDPIWGKRVDLGVVQSNEYHPPQLPSPQDWVLVLERADGEKPGMGSINNK